jgi:hypothetical protein
MAGLAGHELLGGGCLVACRSAVKRSRPAEDDADAAAGGFGNASSASCAAQAGAPRVKRQLRAQEARCVVLAGACACVRACALCASQRSGASNAKGPLCEVFRAASARATPCADALRARPPAQMMSTMHSLHLAGAAQQARPSRSARSTLSFLRLPRFWHVLLFFRKRSFALGSHADARMRVVCADVAYRV